MIFHVKNNQIIFSYSLQQALKRYEHLEHKKERKLVKINEILLKFFMPNTFLWNNELQNCNVRNVVD